jgi:hypothetical protein
MISNFGSTSKALKTEQLINQFILCNTIEAGAMKTHKDTDNFFVTVGEF